MKMPKRTMYIEIVALIVIAISIITILFIFYMNNGSNPVQYSYSPITSNNGIVNSSSGLSLSLSATVAPSGSPNVVAISVSVNNTLDTYNNIAMSNAWKYPSQSLNPFDPCGAPGPIGFAIFSGYYDLSNYTKAQALDLYNMNATYMCTTMTFASDSYYSFMPHSDIAFIVPPGTQPGQVGDSYTAISISFNAIGFWSNTSEMSATFRSFPTGSYTVLGADEWGNVVLVHLQISYA